MVSTPERVAISAAIILVLIPPVPSPVELPPAIWRISGVIFSTTESKVALGSLRGSAVNKPSWSVNK